MKLVGSLLVFGGGFLIWQIQAKEQTRRRELLLDLLSALRRMQEEIRMARTPLPLLWESVSKCCRVDAAALFERGADAVRRGENLTEVWKSAVEALPLDKREKEILRAVSFQGDEDAICKGMALAAYELSKCAEEHEEHRRAEEQRTAALCFSGTALLVILLI